MSHSIDIRVYYEDTDAGGLVYHANYLKFMERARSEWLRSFGFENQKLMNERGLCFVVARIDIAYKRPAFLDDVLTASAAIADQSPMRLKLRQDVKRGEDAITEATVDLAMIDLKTNRAASLPEDIRASLRA